MCSHRARVILTCYWQSQNTKSEISLSRVHTKRHSSPRSFCEGGMSANPLFLLPHSQPAPFRTTMNPPPINSLWISLACDLGHMVAAGRTWPDSQPFFPPPLSGQWAGKWRTQCRFMRLIIRSQLIPILIIWQLGPVDQHMPFWHFWGESRLQTLSSLWSPSAQSSQ